MPGGASNRFGDRRSDRSQELYRKDRHPRRPFRRYSQIPGERQVGPTPAHRIVVGSHAAPGRRPVRERRLRRRSPDPLSSDEPVPGSASLAAAEANRRTGPYTLRTGAPPFSSSLPEPPSLSRRARRPPAHPKLTHSPAPPATGAPAA